MKTIAIGSGIAAFAVLAGSALADTSPTVTEKFAEMDINTDGAVTVGEYTAYAGAAGFDEDEAELQFAVMAGDDGILAVEERLPWVQRANRDVFPNLQHVVAASRVDAIRKHELVHIRCRI